MKTVYEIIKSVEIGTVMIDGKGREWEICKDEYCEKELEPNNTDTVCHSSQECRYIVIPGLKRKDSVKIVRVAPTLMWISRDKQEGTRISSVMFECEREAREFADDKFIKWPANEYSWCEYEEEVEE